ncbi:hypothetical protein JGU66_04450 [Myxococcaceae bacterium JPH2]|nr:hypothetical protein [Myxococcaceae bacterium JPH2]
MADAQWGNCKGCRFFASKNASPEDREVHNCNHPKLRPFELEVSGASGCNVYEARTSPKDAYEEPAPSVQ